MWGLERTPGHYRGSMRMSLFLLTTSICFGCVEPYPLPPIESESQILIVDGFLDASANEASVLLTRAVNLNDTSSATPELNAIVTLLDLSGNKQPLNEVGNGRYRSQVSVNRDGLYQLEINMKGERYYSEFVPVLSSPAIDSVNWRSEPSGLSVHVSTHDPSGNSRFYMWKYYETWEYRAAFQSSFIYTNGGYTYRLPDQDIYHCWRDRASSEILIGSTNQLNQDIVSDLRLLYIPDKSEKTLQKYSVLVQQTAITQDAYDFWQQLKKNTESLGTLFDPQPSQISGNLISQDGEPVIGYFSASTTSSKRLTFELNDLPREHRFIADPGLCEEDTVLLADLPKFEPKTFNLVVGVYNTVGMLIGFRYATHPCTDCSLQGGTRNKPEFW